MEKIATRCPTWKTLDVSSFSRSFANNSLTGKKSTPKWKGENSKDSQKTVKSKGNHRLSIRDERLLQIFTSRPDQPLIETATAGDSSNDCFVCSGQSNTASADKRLFIAQTSDENSSPNQINLIFNESMVRKVQSENPEKDSTQDERPTTPVAAMIPSNLAATPMDSHPFMARIQRDLNSPSAATRIRAIKALKSPTKSTYANFDIPHEEQDIITEEERQSPEKPKSIQELMKDVVVYVEVRTGEDNRSAGVKKVISALGAKVNDKLLRGTTHVVFKDGLLSTYNKAKKWEIPIVSILWIEACKNQRKLINPKSFPISNADRYENPELYDKMKRHKSMQPDAEENRRIRAKASTPKETNSGSTSNIKKTDISRYFMSLGDQTRKTICSESEKPSPASHLTDRLNGDLNIINKTSADIHINDGVHSIMANKDNVISSSNFISSEKTQSSKPTRRTVRRRNSCMQASTCVDEQLMSLDKTPHQSCTRNTRRRSSNFMEMNMNITEEPGLSQTLTKTQCSAITEEDDVSIRNSNIWISTPKSSKKRGTSFTEKTVELSDKVQSKPSRRTLFTPRKIEANPEDLIPKLSNKRRTMFNVTKFTYVDVLSSPQCTATPNKVANLDNESLTPNQNVTLIENQSSAVLFNSAKAPNRRRTLFDVSMDIISQRLQNINQSAKSNRYSRSNGLEMDINCSVLSIETASKLTNPAPNPVVPSPLIDNQNIRKELFNSANDSTEKVKETSLAIDCPSNTINPDTTMKKKRKLYVPNEAILTPPVELEANKAASKRRKTMLTSIKLTGNNSNKGVRDNSRRSTMDFESVKKKTTTLIKTAINTNSSKTKFSAMNYNKQHQTQLSMNAQKPTKTVSSNSIKSNGNAKSHFLVYTNMHREQIETVKEAIRTLGRFYLEDNVSHNTTHIVSLEPRRTLNILRALARGLWILNYNWIIESIKVGHWLDEEQYELREFSRAVEVCRSERQAFGYGYKIDLFAGLGAIYISSRDSTIPKKNLTELIQLCSGRVVEQRKRAKYIIGDNSKQLPDKIYLTSFWILDSITNNQIQKLRKYMYSDNGNITNLKEPNRNSNNPTSSQI